MIVVYRGTAEDRLYYVTGEVNAAGELVGDEHKLTTSDDKRRGRQPSIAIAESGRAELLGADVLEREKSQQQLGAARLAA